MNSERQRGQLTTDLQARNKRTSVCGASLRRMGINILGEDNDAGRSRGNNERSAAGYHAAKNDDLGAAGIAFSLRDGGLGPSHGMDQSSNAIPVTGRFNGSRDPCGRQIEQGVIV